LNVTNRVTRLLSVLDQIKITKVGVLNATNPATKWLTVEKVVDRRKR